MMKGQINTLPFLRIHWNSRECWIICVQWGKQRSVPFPCAPECNWNKSGSYLNVALKGFEIRKQFLHVELDAHRLAFKNRKGKWVTNWNTGEERKRNITFLSFCFLTTHSVPQAWWELFCMSPQWVFTASYWKVKSRFLDPCNYTAKKTIGKVYSAPSEHLPWLLCDMRSRYVLLNKSFPIQFLSPFGKKKNSYYHLLTE